MALFNTYGFALGQTVILFQFLMQCSSGFRWRSRLALWLVVCGLPATAIAVESLPEQICAGCHAQQVNHWQQSHHAKAMLPATPDNVLARFDSTITRFNGTAFRFVQIDGAYQVIIGENDAAQIYPIDYTFGVEPLQQYLARLPGGRYQALPVAWDARPQAEGGQRWYALESDLEWDHPGFTWNTSCAECHSTRLEKNYDASSGIFNTRFEAVNVSCEACHGEASGHLNWLSQKTENVDNAGFSASLSERGEWQWLEGRAIAQRRIEPAGAQLSSCAQCHSRRQAVGPWHPGSKVFDHVMPTLITPPQYHLDGQIRDEVFVLGSFLQSRMHGAGVVCSNCHEPHSTRLRAEGDGVCLQCHKGEVFAAPTHHQHQAGSVNCVDCHMPSTVYMGVDPRRDHRFGIPDPMHSADIGSPDACRTCHAGASAEWLAQRLPEKPSASTLRSRQFAQAMGEALSPGDVHRIDSGYFPPIQEASLLTRLNPADEDERAVLLSKLRHRSALVRASAVRQVGQMEAADRWRLLRPLLTERSTAVRMELAPVLAGAVPASVDSETRQQLAALFKWYEQTMQANLDSPQLASNFANYRMAQGQVQETLALYRRAIELDPGFVYPYLQLAALQRGTPEELSWLQKAREIDEHSGEAAYQFGLYHIRQKAYGLALKELAAAYSMAPQRSDFAYTYAVALENAGALDEAIDVLAAFEGSGDATDRTRDLYLRYLLKAGKENEAQKVLNLWLKNDPANTAAQTWSRWLQQRRAR